MTSNADLHINIFCLMHFGREGATFNAGGSVTISTPWITQVDEQRPGTVNCFRSQHVNIVLQGQKQGWSNQARWATTLRPQTAKIPKGPILVIQIVFGNLINCKFIWS